jgi:hypothetical protein
MSSFFTRNIVWVIMATILSIDLVAIQSDFLASLGLLPLRNVFMGWLGCAVLIAICIFPIGYALLAWIRFIPAKIAPFLELIPFSAFCLWAAFIGYLAVVTRLDTVSVRLKSDLSMDKTQAIDAQARSTGIPMTIVWSRGQVTAWINAKYAERGRALCNGYVAEK